MPHAPTLFDPATLNGMRLRNRFVRSATHEGLAEEDGSASPALAALWRNLAEGEVGLVISGHAYVAQNGKVRTGQLGVDSDALLPGLSGLAHAVHAAGGVCALQLAHGGAHAEPLPTGELPGGPSEMELDGKKICTTMNCEQIGYIVDAFGNAARRAKDAGFDAVQVHAAHGYCLSQFLSPRYNHREDEYGGSLENRARFLLEVLQAVRSEVGDDFPVLIKLNSQDYLDDGLTLDDALLLCRRLENMGIDAVELSGGTMLSGALTPVRAGRFDTADKQAWFREAALRFKSERNVPLMLVGGIRSLEVAEALLADGVCDFISLSRPLVREPDLVKRWHAGDRRPATCVSDNLCFRAALSRRGLCCLSKERENQKQRDA
ncbi:MAG: NADH:flavin oxidoreductase [Desulfovibrio sp.]